MSSFTNELSSCGPAVVKRSHVSSAYGWIVIVVVLNSAAQLMLKASAEFGLRHETSILHLSYVLNIYAICAGACLCITFLAWRKALARIPLSRAHPVCSLVYAITPAAACYWFGDAVSIPYYSGIACICCGIFLISTPGKVST
ncbi:MAG: EamA family transporter [Syntrophobacteraceae bacterium]|jgi:drug/metabolite transporter (DMT)-like permease